jgi:DNA-binding PadR family transcriptional regulator
MSPKLVIMSDKREASLIIRGRRGILPLYILQKLSSGPASGYDLMSDINSVTEGSWRPGSGSVYPVLKSLMTKNLIKVSGTGDRSKRLYSLTDKGRLVLEEAKQVFDTYSLQRWHTIRGVMMAVVAPASLAKMLNETIEMQPQAWDKILKSALTREDKLFLLRQHKLLVDRHALWIDKKIAELSEDHHHKKDFKN